MEILESQDPEKKRLMDEAKKHKLNLGNDVREISERTETIVTNALIIGGSLAFAYLVVRQLSSGKSKKKKSKTIKVVSKPAGASDSEEIEDEVIGTPNLLAEIGTKIVNEATLFLLNLAKEKLMEYLDSRKETQHEDH